MVRWALDRARRVAPPERTLVVVNGAHRRHWEADLADVPRHNRLVQPRNRGTAAGVLLAMLTIRARAGEDTPVVFLPSDHAVSDELALQTAVEVALRAAVRSEQGVVLLGMEPGEDDQEFGWVLPADGYVVAEVRRFVEKPPPGRVRSLVQAGGLINSFVFAARVRTLVDLCSAALPLVTNRFLAHVRYSLGVCALHELYDAIAASDLSRDVLQRAASRLLVVKVPECGWSDLGTPERLQAFLTRREASRAAMAGAAAARSEAAA